MCYSQKILLTDEMAEKMTIAKAEGEEEEGGENEYRNKILEKIGDCCAAQVCFALCFFFGVLVCYYFHYS